MSTGDRRLKSSEVKAVREELLKQQGGVCAICDKVPVIPCLDHDHFTGAVRGVLCSGCNAYEGKIIKWKCFAQVDDLPTWLENLATYYREHEVSKHDLLHPTHKTKDEKIALAKKRRARKLKGSK